MFEKQLDFLAVGDTAVDAFIRMKDANVHCSVDNSNCELCVKFGDKIPYEFVKEIFASGNASNASICASRLGLRSGIITSVGNDYRGNESIEKLKNEKVVVRNISIQNNVKTNYHFVLWYGPERTILTKHESKEYIFPKIKKTPKWIYLSSLGQESEKYHSEILNYLNKNSEVKLAFQPGTFQIKLGFEKLKEIYKRTDILICNSDEAGRIIGNKSEVKDMLSKILSMGPKQVLITDGPKGAYYSDGNKFLFMPAYPDELPPYERTGAGDAFSATFISALIKGKSVEEALAMAPINSASVVQFVGAQEGLLSMNNIENKLKNAPSDYKVKIV